MAGAANAGIVTYSGSLSIADGGLVGTGAWGVGPSSVSWVVTQVDMGPVHYEYTLSVPVGGVSHVVLETSANFTEADIWNVSVTGADSWNVDLKTHRPQQGNPEMPGNVYGLKIELEEGATTATFAFDSSRQPMWGDIYSKDGRAGRMGLNTVRNVGFTEPDWDPVALPANGALMGHLLVPDTTFVIPEPVSAAWLVMVVPATAVVRRRRAA